MSACHGCGIDLPPSWGRPRTWCSERCRKAQYAGTCEVCGGSTDGTTPSRGPAATVCQDCRNWTEEGVIDAMRRWAEERGGIPPTSQEWDRASVAHPCSNTVSRRFGWDRMLLQAGFALRCDRRPETLEWIVAQIRAGISTQDIADALGCTPQNIYVRMHTRGLRVSELRAEGRAA